MKALVVILTFLFSFLSFAAPSLRKADDDLTLELAKQRRSQISVVKYDLFIGLEKNKEGYKGKVTIDLVLNDLSRDLSLDSMIDKIESLIINGKKVSKFPSRKGSFDLPKSLLQKNSKVEITFSNAYSKDASGFQRVIDPEERPNIFTPTSNPTKLTNSFLVLTNQI